MIKVEHMFIAFCMGRLGMAQALNNWFLFCSNFLLCQLSSETTKLPASRVKPTRVRDNFVSIFLQTTEFPSK